MGTNTPEGMAGNGLKHRTMRNVSMGIGLVVTAVFGFLTAIFGLAEGEAMILFVLLLLGLLLPNMFLHFIVQEEGLSQPK